MTIQGAWKALTNPRGAATEFLQNVAQDAAAAAAGNLAASVQGAAQGSPVDEHINYLYTLTKPRPFQKASGASAGLDPSTAPLEDFVSRIDSIIANAESLFGHPLTQEDRNTFYQLKGLLNQEIHTLTTNEVQEKALESTTIGAAYAALGKLRFLKFQAAGGVTNKSMTLAAAPELSSSLEALGKLQLALSHENRENINKAIEHLNASIDTLIKYKKHIFIGKPLTPAHQTSLQALQTLTQRYAEIPDSLKYTRVFKPTEIDLMGQIEASTDVLSHYLKDQNGALTQLVTQLKQTTQTALAGALPNAFSPGAKTVYSSFDKLNDALNFFQNVANLRYTSKEKKEALLTLLTHCGAEFKTDFSQHLHTLLEPGAAGFNEAYVKQHLIESFEHLRAAFNHALREHAQKNNIPAGADTPEKILEHIRQNTPQQEAPQGAGTHSIMDYVNAALQYLQGTSPFITATFPAIGKNFAAILKSDSLNNWIAKQSAAHQGAFENLKQQVLQRLENAKTADDFKQAFNAFKTAFNAQHWIVEGFELPTLFEDSAITEAHTQASKNLTQALAALKKDLREAPIHPKTDGFDWQDGEQAKAKIHQQLDLLSYHLRDRLTYRVVYEKLIGVHSPDENAFYTIKQLQAAQPTEGAKRRLFLKEMRNMIKHSKASWIKKVFARIILSGFHQFIGYYTMHMVHNFYKYFDKDPSKVKLSEFLTRTSHCLSKYNALLKNWAALPHGGDKIPTLNRMLQTREYLEYDNRSYTQAQLYKAASHALVNDYMELLHAQNNEDSLRGRVGAFRQQVNSVIANRPFRAQTSAAGLLNALWVGAKAIVLGVPTYLFTSIASVILAPIDWVSNYCVKRVCQSSLGHLKFLGRGIQEARAEVYENNPYSPMITQFMAGQLEALSNALDQEAAAGAKPVVSDKTRAGIKTTFEHLFEILDKDRFTTQEQLQEHLKTQNSMGQHLDHLLMPGTIDALVNAALLLSNQDLTKKATYQPIFSLLDTLNRTLVEPPAPVSDADKKEHQAAEAKMHQYADRVIRQVVKQATDSAFNHFGQQEAEATKSTLTWTKETMGQLLTRWRDSLAGVDAQASDQERYHTLETLMNESNKFLADLHSRYETLNAQESRTSKELASQLLKVIEPFQNFIKGPHGGVLALYTNYFHLDQDAGDLPYLGTCERAYTIMQQDLDTLRQDALREDVKKRFFDHALLFQKTLSDLSKGKITLSHDVNTYAPLKAALNAQNETFFKQHAFEIDYIEKKVLPHLSALQATRKDPDLFNRMRGTKRLQIQGQQQINSHNVFYRLVASNAQASQGWNQTYQQTLQAIKNIPEQAVQQALLKALDKVYYAKTEPAANDAIAAFEKLLDDSIQEGQGKLQQSQTRLNTLHTPIYNELHQLTTTLRADAHARSDANQNTLQPQLTVSLHQAQEALNAIEEIPFVAADLGVLQSLKKYPSHLVYGRLKTNMDSFLNLARNGAFAQFFINHMLLMPLVKK